ncbi:hypothetical protein D3C75_859590 [compost metagenome]
MRLALSIGSLRRVSWPRLRVTWASSLRRASRGSSLSSLHAWVVGWSGSGVLPLPALWAISCFTSALRLALAASACLLGGAR